MGTALKIRDDLTALELRRRRLRVDARRSVAMDDGPVRQDLSPSSLSQVLHPMGFSRQKARSANPRRDTEAQERFKNKGSARR